MENHHLQDLVHLEGGVLQEKHALARVWLERGTEQGKEKTEIIIMILIPKSKSENNDYGDDSISI